MSFEMAGPIHTNGCKCDDPSCVATRAVFEAISRSLSVGYGVPASGDKIVSALNALSRCMALFLASAKSDDEMEELAAIFIQKMSQEAHAARRGDLAPASN